MLDRVGVRRARRVRTRRVQAALLAGVVLAATTGGFLALRRAFDEGGRNLGDETTRPFPANGEIVFSRPLPDGSEHLFAVQPGQEGERRITPVGKATYREPSISPDGQTIVVAHSIPSFEGEGYASVIATVPIQGGAPTWLTDPVGIVQDPEWSPHGTKIAFAGRVPGGGGSGIHVMNADGSDIRLIAGSDSFDVLSPDWSPDGSRIVFMGWNDGVTQPDLYSIALDGSDLINLTQTPDVDELAPAWSPDGSLIAFIARPVGTAEGTIDLVTPGGDAAGRVSGIGDGVVLELDWSPDGQFIAFLSDLALTDSDTDGDLDLWIVRPDGSDLRNFTTEGVSGITWQPLPAGSDPEPSPPSVSASPSPALAGRDIGLAFPLCNIEQLGGIDWYGDGKLGTAWTGARTNDDGRCPSEGDGEYVVAADLDGDGVAEPGGMGFLEHCLFCRPFAATDLNADGVLELVVLEEASSTPSYSIYEVSVPTSERSPGIYALFVAPPGAPVANLPANEPIRFIVGGDEGFSGGLRCENYPEAPVVVYTWFFGEVDADTDLQGHEAHLSLGEDGIFHVLDTSDFAIGRDEPTNISTSPACGVDFHPAP